VLKAFKLCGFFPDSPHHSSLYSTMQHLNNLSSANKESVLYWLCKYLRVGYLIEAYMCVTPIHNSISFDCVCISCMFTVLLVSLCSCQMQSTNLITWHSALEVTSCISYCAQYNRLIVSKYQNVQRMVVDYEQWAKLANPLVESDHSESYRYTVQATYLSRLLLLSNFLFL